MSSDKLFEVTVSADPEVRRRYLERGLVHYEILPGSRVDFVCCNRSGRDLLIYWRLKGFWNTGRPGDGEGLLIRNGATETLQCWPLDQVMKLSNLHNALYSGKTRIKIVVFPADELPSRKSSRLMRWWDRKQIERHGLSEELVIAPLAEGKCRHSESPTADLAFVE